MKLQHPLTGAFYVLHDADPQMIQWVGGPQMGSRGPLGGGRNAAPPPSRS